MRMRDTTIHGERIVELRKEMKINQEEMAKRMGMSKSQLSRIENGETKTLNSNLLIRLADEFDVSTDYILGRSNIQSRRNYDVSSLGLSEKAIQQLVTKRVNVQVVSCLLEHKIFPYLTRLIYTYFADITARGIQSSNDVLQFGYNLLANAELTDPKQKAERNRDLMAIRSQMHKPNEADLEEIKKVFLAILKDIKKDLGEQSEKQVAADREVIRRIQEEAMKLGPENIDFNAIVEIVTGTIGDLTNLDAEGQQRLGEMFKEMANAAGAEQTRENGSEKRLTL